MYNFITYFFNFCIFFLVSSASGCVQNEDEVAPQINAPQSQAMIYASTLPPYQTLRQNYLRYGINVPAQELVTDPELAQILGGYVQHNIDAGIFVNSCAIRVSTMLNRSGDAIPYIANQTSSAANGSKHIFRVVQMNTYLTNRYGQAHINSINPSDFIGHKGIILFDTPGLWSNATGHVTLWDGTKGLGGWATDSLMFSNAASVKLWVAN